MQFPDDLPEIIEYHFGGMLIHGQKVAETIRRCFPRKPVTYDGSSGRTDAAMIIPNIPYGATGWRPMGEEAWRPLSTIPKHWMPFVERTRGTEMDPRPKL